MSNEFPLFGAATSAGTIDTNAIRSAGGSIKVTPEALVVTIATQTFTLTKESITALSVTSGNFSIDTAERNVSGMSSLPRALVAELQANGYQIQINKGKSHLIIIGIVIILLGILYTAFSAAYSMMR